MPLSCCRAIPPPSSSSWRVTWYTTKTGIKSLPRPLVDIKLAMSYGSESLRHLLARNQPIHRKGRFLFFVSSIFPAFGGNVITHLSHSHHTLALFLKLTLLGGAFFCLLLFLSHVLPKPEFKRTECHFALRWIRRFSAASLWALLTVLLLNRPSCRPPAGFGGGI